MNDKIPKNGESMYVSVVCVMCIYVCVMFGVCVRACVLYEVCGGYVLGGGVVWCG